MSLYNLYVCFIYIYIYIYTMTYEGSKSAWENFGKFNYQLQPKFKAPIRKLERNLIKL